MSMSNDYSRSRLMCPTCRRPHEAEYVEKQGEAFWRVHCPQGEKEIKMSSDATLFSQFRDSAPYIPKEAVRKVNICIFHINENCSLQCPICYADADTKGWRMTLDDLRKRATRVKKVRPSLVSLSGGEPTEHEEIIEIVRILAQEFRFKVSILTNGVRLGTDPSFASQLKKAGLRKVSVSFDTFKPDVSVRMRGQANLVDIKLKALQNCFDAGLNCGIVATLCDANISEIGDLLRFVLKNARHMSIFETQCLQKGRRVPEDIHSVDREQIVKELVRSGVIANLKADDFAITPCVPSFGFCVHPDCGAGLLILVKNGTGRLLSDEFDQAGFFRAISKMNFWNRHFKRLWFMILFLKYFGLRGLRLKSHWLYGDKHDSESLVMFGITTLMTPDKMDCERVKRCPNCVVLENGVLMPTCFNYCYVYKQPGGENT